MVSADRPIEGPSRFFLSQLPRLHAERPRGPLLDLACGRGRHAMAAAREGWTVIAVDRSRERLDELAAARIDGPGSIETIECDLEAESDGCLGSSRFAAIIVSRYLHRPLMPWIAEALRPNGLLLYETFTTAQRQLGWGPKRDDFLLEPEELPKLFPSLEVLFYAEGLSQDQPAAQSARLMARRPR